MNLYIPPLLRPLLLTAHVLPAVVFAYLPMAGQLRFSPGKTAGFCLGAYTAFLLPATALYLAGFQVLHVMLGIAAAASFFLYRYTVKVSSSQALAVYLTTCALMSYPVHFSYMLDARLHPESGSSFFSPERSLFVAAASVLLVLLLVLPVRRYLGWLIDRLDIPKAWHSISAMASLFLLINLFVVPRDYRTLYTGRMFLIYFMFEVWCLLIQTALHRAFYLIAEVMIRHTEQEQKNRLLEMQASQYETLCRHMRETSQLRHDFRHSVHLLRTLADKEDWASVKQYLQEYAAQPEAAPGNYCANAALNALFCYYQTQAADAGIRTEWKLDLPEPLTISEVDMASLFGNLIENAISGCCTVPEKERYFSLSAAVQQGNRLYIVSTNSFDGKVKISNKKYLTTRPDGQGLGLLSVTTIAERHQGTARFTNQGREFWADVVINL